MITSFLKDAKHFTGQTVVNGDVSFYIQKRIKTGTSDKVYKVQDIFGDYYLMKISYSEKLLNKEAKCLTRINKKSNGCNIAPVVCQGYIIDESNPSKWIYYFVMPHLGEELGK